LTPQGRAGVGERKPLVDRRAHRDHLRRIAVDDDRLQPPATGLDGALLTGLRQRT
jgi:hypothetical protein